MDLYTEVSYKISQRITLDYSTSFSSSTKLFPTSLRPHIYAIYGLVRIADEIVDVYRGKDALKILNELEAEVYASLKRGYSPNPVVHSFAQTATKFNINKKLVQPFFASMAMDIHPAPFTGKHYEAYIYGSAEVVGLMCLRVFLNGDDAEYARLEKGACALGAAYQKINFLRDMASDYTELGRVYFPGVTFETFDEESKQRIVSDIEADLALANTVVHELPASSRRAVRLSIDYYSALLRKLKRASAKNIKQERMRVNKLSKLLIMARANLRGDF